MRRAVLFDVGGPIDREAAFEGRIDAEIRAALADAGLGVGDREYAELCREAVDAFAPNLYRAVIWRALIRQAADGRADMARQAWSRVVERLAAAPPPFEPRPGMDGLLRRLADRGLLLGLVANQPEATLGRMEAAGLARHFRHFAVSGTTGLRKPDPRAFLAACHALGVAAGECVMVGDRIDNDIAPARALGMAAIRFRTGRHAGQRPRCWDEVPDADVADVAALEDAIARLCG